MDQLVGGGPGLKVTKLPSFGKEGDSSSGTNPKVFSPKFYKMQEVMR